MRPDLRDACAAWVAYLDGPGDGADDAALEERLMENMRRALSGAIEVLVPRLEPSMSMFANKQDYETARAGTGVQPPAGEDVYHLRAYGDVSKEQLDYYSVHGTLDGFGETQRSPQPSRPDEKEGLQGPAIEDRARLLDALETIDIIWRHYVKPHTSDWRETEKAIKTIRAALGVEPDAAIRERT